MENKVKMGETPLFSTDEVQDLIAANTVLESVVTALQAENEALGMEVTALKGVQATERNLAQGNPTGFYLLCPVNYAGRVVRSADLTAALVADLQALGCTLLQQV
jgi:hypothetical protein